jgi:hypothetical protein
MAGFGGLLGHLAGGYADAAEKENRRQFEAEQNQRQAALGMTKILLENPAVPPEYKGILAQYGMDVIHTPHGKKIPDFQKNVLATLPALPGKPNPGPGNTKYDTAMTLPGPQPPPGLPEGTAGPQQLGGPLGISPIAPGPEVQIPGAVIQPPAPAPAANISERGQFHMMSDEEQVGRQTAAKIAAAQAVSKETGVPVERVLGLQPKYSVAPWGAGTFNQQTGEIETPSTPKPMGTPIKMKAEDGTYHLYQRFQDNSLRPIDNPNGMSVPLPTAELPTVTQSSHDVNLETGASSTKTVRQKVQPGSKSLSVPTAPPGVGKPVPSASASAGSGPGGSRTKSDIATDKALATDAIKASQTARTMVNLLDTQQQYIDSIKAGGAPTPRQDLSLIVAAVRAMNPGTVRLPNKELELELKAGSYGDRMRRYFETASSGILPADQREDLFSVVDHETSNVAKDAAANWQQSPNLKGRPLPPHLKRFAGSGSGASGNNPSQGGMIAVTDPAGGVHYFKDQAGADQFKAALAGAK